MSASLRPLFHPTRIAVIGASANPEKLSFQILRNIREAGFPGEVIPVNPKGEQILGAASVKSVGDLPEGVDLAVVIIPAKLVPGTIAELGERKVPAAIVISGGFAESGEAGAALQEELARNAARFGIRVVGPNCQGVNYPYHSLCASWPLITRKGQMAIFSQSGTVGAALIDWASEDGLGFSAFVSMGNRADVDEADLIDFFADDPNTKVLALYIEGVKHPAKFLAAIRRCRKPIVILKPGRTERGRKAAESHTRSLAGSDAINDTVFRQFGIHRAATLEELYDFAKALAYVPAPDGPRMLIVTSSGGSAVIATDVATEEGFRVDPLPAPVAEDLRGFLPPHCIVGNPLDLTGDATAERYRKVLTTAEGHYDVLMSIFGDPIPGASTVVRSDRCDLVAYLGGADVERTERRLIHEKRIAVFPTPERAVRALACHARFDRAKFPREPEGQAVSRGSERGQALSPADSMTLLARSGFPVAAFRAAATAEEAVAAAQEIGFPVAVKMNSTDVTHKSDVGGVILNLTDEAGVRNAYDAIHEIVTRIGARHGGVLVSAMAPRGQEVVVGLTKDPQFGPVVMFGLGGILVEVLKDVAFGIVPVTEKDAEEMIGEIRGARILQGVRGGRPADVAALRQLLVQVSDLVVKHPEIAEMDLNPVIVYENGLLIVDARIVPANGSA
jgi:acyl-CoA synthetase (NDP forming)